MFISMIFYFLMAIFVFKKKEEKVMLCVNFLVYFCFLYFNGEMSGWGMVLDDLSFSMVFLSILLMIVVFMSSSDDKHYYLCFSMMVIVLYFLVESLFFFFILFEFSLVPVFFLISFFGYQPERLKAVKFMMMYTLIASCPLLFFVIYMVQVKGVVLISMIHLKVSGVSEYLIFAAMLAFWVKIPLFFFHSWLPKAHVEAPLEGSMILAGLMLKVGMYGMVRVFFSFPLSSSKEVASFFFSLGMIGSLISVIVAISSDDMKMSVAFSSISHMNFCIASLVSMSVYCIEGWIMVMISHGLCSPMMFYLVTKIYLCSGSRSMMVSKGLVSKFPFFQFLSVLVWSVNISPPPSMSFMGEVTMIFCIFSVYVWSVIFVLVYMVLSSFFSMFNYGVQNHSSEKAVWKSSMSLTVFGSCSIFSFGMIFFFFFFFDLFV